MFTLGPGSLGHTILVTYHKEKKEKKKEKKVLFLYSLSLVIYNS